MAREKRTTSFIMKLAKLAGVLTVSSVGIAGLVQLSAHNAAPSSPIRQTVAAPSYVASFLANLADISQPPPAPLPPVYTPPPDYRLDATTWSAYLQARNEDNIPETLAACDAAPQSCDPRIAAWGQFIEAVSQVTDPRVKAELVNGWVNTVIAYDADKANAMTAGIWTPPASYRHKTFLQTPFDTLRGGKGICGDQAILKYETLRLAGFPARDMELVAGLEQDSSGAGGHMIVAVDVDGQKLALDNQPSEGLEFYDPPSVMVANFADNADPDMMIPAASTGAAPAGSGWLQLDDGPSFMLPDTVAADPASALPFLNSDGIGAPCAHGESLVCIADATDAGDPESAIDQTCDDDIDRSLDTSPVAPALLRSIAAAFALGDKSGS